jgi:hypothetical protein
VAQANRVAHPQPAAQGGLEPCRASRRERKEARLARRLEWAAGREQKVLADVARFQPYYIKNGCPTFPPYALSNLSGNIRRLKDRRATIEAKGGDND